MFKKWHVDNKVLEKLFHERQNTIKVFSGGRHTEITKNPKTALSNIIKVILPIGDIIKVTKSLILLEKS